MDSQTLQNRQGNTQACPRPYQETALQTILAARQRGLQRVLVTMPTGTGKCLGRDTPVLMYDGSIKPVQEIAVGDQLKGPDSTPRTVLSICSGVDRMYRVIPNKGEPYRVNEPHILSLKMTHSQECGGLFRTGNIVNISVRDYLAQNRTFRHCAKGYRVPVEFPAREVVIDPYYLGVWLGDGISHSTSVISIDREVIEYLRQYAERSGLNLITNPYKNRATRYSITSGIGAKKNPLWDALRDYALLKNKHVPTAFKCNTRDVRLQVLAGIVDSDGHLSSGVYDITFKNKTLADDTV